MHPSALANVKIREQIEVYLQGLRDLKTLEGCQLLQDLNLAYGMICPLPS